MLPADESHPHTTTVRSTLPRTMSPALFPNKHSFDVNRMSASAPLVVTPATQNISDSAWCEGLSDRDHDYELDAAPPAAKLQTGDVVKIGPNAGWIYCEGDSAAPFLVASKDSGVMDWFDACDTAEREGAALPDGKQLNAIYESRNKGALRDTFNMTGSGPAGCYWSSSQLIKLYAWTQRFSDGYQITNFKDFAASLRCVRRLSL